MVRNKMQYEFESTGSAVSLDEGVADGPELFPFGKIIGPNLFVFPFFLRIEIPVLASVYLKSIIGADRGFLDQKRIKGFGSQKLSHELFDIFYFESNHIYTRPPALAGT